MGNNMRYSLTAILFSTLFTTILFEMRLTAEEPARDKSPMRSDDGNARSDFNPIEMFSFGKSLFQAKQIHPAIYQATGVSNTTMVVTDEGNVVIDTALAQVAPLHKRALKRSNNNKVTHIILTHAHKDHTGGLPTWRTPDTEVIAHENSVEFLHYQARLAAFFSKRNSAQFDISLPAELPKGNFGADIHATTLFKDEHHFKLGGVDFHLFHTPGETHDHISVWIPQYKAAIVGDNYYRSFPNLYTPRGTKPRWALDYVKSIDTVLGWEPEILISGHSAAIAGKEQVRTSLSKYRDAILHVHDQTVAGMNAGKSVHTLMKEIKLPKENGLSEKYGSVAWSVRGIYEGYAGWFDGNPSSLYTTPRSDVYPDIVKMAGGPTMVAKTAMQRIEHGEIVAGLHLADIAIAADASNVIALQARISALTALEKKASNSIEAGWLRHGIRETESQLAKTVIASRGPKPAELRSPNK